MMGYSVDDAAQVMEVPPGTIKSRCARGRARLAPFSSTTGTDGNAKTSEVWKEVACPSEPRTP